MKPVAVELGVQELQVIEGGVGRGDDVPAAVVPPVLLQAIAATGGGYELPQSRRMGAGVGRGLERAFYGGEQGNFHRYSAALHFLHNVVEISARSFHHTGEEFGSVLVPVLVVTDVLVIHGGQSEAVADPLPKIVIPDFRSRRCWQRTAAERFRGRGGCRRGFRFYRLGTGTLQAV
jgi:hypothetical protein